MIMETKMNRWSYFGIEKPVFQVELIGGPCDGEFRQVSELETRLSLPILRETVDETATSDLRSNTVTSIAIYVLAVKDGRWVYLFLRCVKPHKAISDDTSVES